jgi:hypothetical protein
MERVCKPLQGKGLHCRYNQREKRAENGAPVENSCLFPLEQRDSWLQNPNRQGGARRCIGGSLEPPDEEGEMRRCEKGGGVQLFHVEHVLVAATANALVRCKLGERQRSERVPVATSKRRKYLNVPRGTLGLATLCLDS